MYGRSAALGIVAAMIAWPASPQLQEPAAARGSDVLRSACVTCHGSELISQQRLTRDGWARELDKMTGWGAVLTPADRGALLDHLAERFGPDARAAAPADPGASLLESRCLACHDRRLIEQQRLDADGWRREVDKMIGWGASVGAQEKEPLVAYLARQYR